MPYYDIDMNKAQCEHPPGATHWSNGTYFKAAESDDSPSLYWSTSSQSWFASGRRLDEPTMRRLDPPPPPSVLVLDVLVPKHIFADMLNAAMNRMADRQQDARKRLAGIDLHAEDRAEQFASITEEFDDAEKRYRVIEKIKEAFDEC